MLRKGHCSPTLTLFQRAILSQLQQPCQEKKRWKASVWLPWGVLPQRKVEKEGWARGGQQPWVLRAPSLSPVAKGFCCCCCFLNRVVYSPLAEHLGPVIPCKWSTFLQVPCGGIRKPQLENQSSIAKKMVATLWTCSMLIWYPMWRHLHAHVTDEKIVNPMIPSARTHA